MWVMAAISVVGAIMNFMGASSAAAAQTIINRANAKAENMVRDAQNVFRAASTSFSNYQRAENNKQKFKLAGAEFAAAGQNIVRLRDQVVKGSIQQRVKAAEELGALQAQASMMGIGGGVVDQIDRQIRTSSRMAQAETEQAVKYQTNDMRAQKFGLMQKAQAASDMGTTFAGIDYTKSIPGFVAKPSFITYALQGISDAMPYMRVALGNNMMKAGQQNSVQPANQSGNSGGWIQTGYGAKTYI